MQKYGVLGLLAWALLSFSGLSQASGNSHAFGYDLVRQLDTAQDGGQLNLSYQISSGRLSAIVFGLAEGDNYQMFEAGFKRYNERLLSGSFFQLGATYWNGSNGFDSDLGADLRIGYEWPLTRWAVFSAAISGVYGPDHPVSGKSSEIIFRPHLGILVHF